MPDTHSNPDHTGTTAEQAPVTMKDRIVGLTLGLVLCGVGAATWIWPAFHVAADQQTGRGGRRVAWLIDLLWSRPAGTVVGVLGLLVLVGVITRKNRS